MSTTWLKVVALSLILASITGCKKGGDAQAPASSGSQNSQGSSGSQGQPGTAGCESISGGTSAFSSSVDPGCSGCSITDDTKAADGDLSTYASATVNQAAPNSGVTFRATAQSGIVFPAGNAAGAYISVPQGTGQNYSVTIRTLLSGAVQESVNSDNSGTVGCGMCGGHPSAFDGFTTTKTFDAVEVFITNNQAGGTPVFGVYEICSDHRGG